MEERNGFWLAEFVERVGGMVAMGAVCVVCVL